MLFGNLGEGVPAAGAGILIPLRGCKPDLITQVHIISKGETLGVKRFRGAESYDVEVSCYLDDTLGIEPYFSRDKAGFQQMSSWMGYFSLRATEYDAALDGPAENAPWIETDQIPYTAGTVPCTPWEPLMEMKSGLEISRGENLEIPLLLDDTYAWSNMKVIGRDRDAVTSLVWRADDGGEKPRMFSYFINSAFVEDFFECTLDGSFRIEITAGTTGSTERLFKTIAVREMPVGGVRLCWVNRYGTIDYFTFSPVRVAETSTDKTRVKGTAGRTVAAADRKDTVTVITPWMTPEDLGGLSGILSSPKAWHVKEGEIIPVDILTGRSQIGFERPGTMQVTFSYC